MPSRAARLGAVGVVALFAAIALQGCRAKLPPNVLVVVLDTARADAVSAYGSGDAHTPVFDSLAAQGVLYLNARTTSAWTGPAHGSLFTGLYPSRHGMHHGHGRLDDGLMTLAEILSPTHSTAAFSENPQVVAAKGFSQGFGHFEETWREQKLAADVAPTVTRVRAWLEVRDKARPFFLFVNLMSPHLPYTPPPEWERRFVSAGHDPELVAQMRTFNEWVARMVITGTVELSPLELEILKGLYRAEVAFADHRLGQILSAVGEAELENTMVAVVGDHGENLGEHGLMEHQFCLYDTLLRVPLVLRLPGLIESGVRRHDAVQLVDLAPTVLDVLGRDRSSWPPFEGVSLLDEPALEGRTLVAEYMRPESQRWRFRRVDPTFDFSRFDRSLTAVIQDGWKLIRSDRDEEELYDLVSDPGETRNLVSDRPQRADRLRHWLSAWQGAAPPPDQGDEPQLDEENVEALRSLGYL